MKDCEQVTLSPLRTLVLIALLALLAMVRKAVPTMLPVNVQNFLYDIGLRGIPAYILTIGFACVIVLAGLGWAADRSDQ